MTDGSPTPAPDRPEPRAPREEIAQTIAWLASVRARARRVLIFQQAAWILALALAVVLVLAVLDYALRTPDWMRVILWLGGIAGLVVSVRRSLAPAVRFAPSLTEVALRLENTPEGQRAGLSGLLAAGVDLSGAGEPGRLAAPVIARAAEQSRGLASSTFLNTARARRSGATLAIVGVLAAGLGVVAPQLAAIGAARILWPLGGADWPKRTGVADVTGLKVHPLGAALPLRAALTKSPRGADETRVSASVRLFVDGRAGARREAVLTVQRQTVDVPGGGTGTLFERLLEPAWLTGEQGAAEPREGEPPRLELEYAFSSDDDETEPVRVLLVEPPKVVAAKAIVTPPAYAASIGGSAGPANLDLGPGTDERATPQAILGGSTMEVSLEFNKPLPGIAPGDRDALAAALGEQSLLVLDAGGTVRAGPGSRVWTLSWTIADSVRLVVRPRDEYGIAGTDEASFRFEAQKDNPPTATVTAPGEDRAVLATAVVEFSGEARDDVGLRWVALERQLARRPGGSEGAPAAAVGDRTELVRLPAGDTLGVDAAAQSVRTLTASQTLDLSTLELKPGDELWLTAVAQDAFELSGARHEPVRSTVRRLRIMSRDELVEQIWGELSAVRRTAIRMDEEQRELGEASAQRGETNARQSQRAQASMTERLARQGEAVRALSRRVAENNLTDESVRDVLRASEESLARAGEQSQQAGEELGRAAEAQAQEAPPPEAGQPERERAADNQRRVRDELANLIDLLDQGRDTWAARRSVERVLEQQKRLRERTAEAAAQTTGKSDEQLSPEQKEALEQIAQEQRAAAEQLKDAVEKMLEREQNLRKNDPAAAQAMAQAARQAQREQTAQTMQRAAQQAQQNQTNSAQESQSRAIASMEQMLRQLDQTAQNRDEVLRRFLASLIDSIGGLIRQQEGELARLREAAPTGNLAGLDARMARLHQNTLGVLDQASEGPRETQGVATILGRAADAQAAAVVALRKAPNPDADDAERRENESLASLKEALEAASKIDDGAERRQQAQKRAQLKGKYEEALKVQLGVQDATRGLVGVEPTRRTRATARQLGQEQAGVRESLAALKTEFKEITDAKVFDFAHERLDKATGEAADTLGAGEATETVARRQTTAVKVLQSLIASLDQGPRPDRPFREGESSSDGSGGGSGSPPLLPPGTELKLLKSMQQEAAELTRAAGEAQRPDAGAIAEAGDLQKAVAEQGKGLLERLKQQSGPRPEPEATPREPGANPAPPEGEAPKDEPARDGARTPEGKPGGGG